RIITPSFGGASPTPPGGGGIGCRPDCGGSAGGRGSGGGLPFPGVLSGGGGGSLASSGRRPSVTRIVRIAPSRTTVTPSFVPGPLFGLALFGPGWIDDQRLLGRGRAKLPLFQTLQDALRRRQAGARDEHRRNGCSERSLNGRCHDKSSLELFPRHT